MNKMLLENKNYNLDEIFEIIAGKPSIHLDDSIKKIVGKSYDIVSNIVESSKTVYGINTGFGKLSQVSIPKEELLKLQENLLLSHAVGVGSLVEDDIVWIMLFIKILSLCKGYSGVSVELIEKLIELLNSGYLPVIPSQGSVGASGDLAPLAHMAFPLICEGEVRKNQKIFSSNKVFKKKCYYKKRANYF